MKKHIGWKRIGWVAGGILLFAVAIYSVHWNLFHGWNETNEWWSWLFSIILSIIGIGVLYFLILSVIWLVTFIYHNGEDKKE